MGVTVLQARAISDAWSGESLRDDRLVVSAMNPLAEQWVLARRDSRWRRGKGRSCRLVESGWDGESATGRSRAAKRDVRTRESEFRVEGRKWCL